MNADVHKRFVYIIISVMQFYQRCLGENIALTVISVKFTGQLELVALEKR